MNDGGLRGSRLSLLPFEVCLLPFAFPKGRPVN
jgi:hypothetical protein